MGDQMASSSAGGTELDFLSLGVTVHLVDGRGFDCSVGVGDPFSLIFFYSCTTGRIGWVYAKSDLFGGGFLIHYYSGLSWWPECLLVDFFLLVFASVMQNFNFE